MVLLELHSIPAATTIEETKNKLVELKVRIAKAEDILETPIQEMQKKTALLQVIDPITKQHTATVKEGDFDRFYTIVMNFANNASMGTTSGAKVSSVAEKEKEKEEAKHDDEGEGGWINGLNNNDGCRICGGMDHWQRECPNKGKGKGKSNSSPKGKGKGPVGGCWFCKGDHYQDNCPKLAGNCSKGGKKGGGGGKKGGGKGLYGGKGKGGLNGFNESWDGGYEHEHWREPEYVPSFCSLKTIEPKTPWQDAKKTVKMKVAEVKNKIESKKSEKMNSFKWLASEDEDEEEAEEFIQESLPTDAHAHENKPKKKIESPRIKKWKRAQKDTQLNIFRTVQQETINAVSEDGQWEEIKLSVDSGATESVVPHDMPESIATTEGPASRRGVEYEVANGVTIPNEGEKKFVAVTEEGNEKKMVVQVCEVNQGLLSVSRACANGNRVVFDSDPNGSYIEHKKTGEKTWMKLENGMYTIRMWVRRPF